MKQKFTIFAAIFSIIAFSATAQVRYQPADPYNNYSVGIGVGYTTIYGALTKSDPEPVVIVNLAKHLDQNVVIGIELQHGLIKSEEPANKWTTGLSETNQYTAFNINGRVTAGTILKNPNNFIKKAISNIYIGAGVGVIDNDITNITNKFKTTDTKTINNDIINSGLSFDVPLNLGINFYLKHVFRGAQLNINYQQNYPFNDDVNGYSFSKSTTDHKYNAVYSVLSAGISFYLGHKDEY